MRAVWLVLIWQKGVKSAHAEPPKLKRWPRKPKRPERKVGGGRSARQCCRWPPPRSKIGQGVKDLRQVRQSGPSVNARAVGSSSGIILGAYTPPGHGPDTGSIAPDAAKKGATRLIVGVYHHVKPQGFGNPMYVGTQVFIKSVFSALENRLCSANFSQTSRTVTSHFSRKSLRAASVSFFSMA